MSETSRSFGEVLRRLRTAAALSQEELAERSGLSRNGISDLERGLHPSPRLETVRLLADGLALTDEERAALVAAARPVLLGVNASGSSPKPPGSLPTPRIRLIERETEHARTPLVGRVREQILLRDRMSAAFSGQGSVVLIGGDAGIGKTMLATGMGHEAAIQGASVLIGHAYQMAVSPPYGLWTELLAQEGTGAEGFPTPLETLQGETEASATQAALFAAVRDALTALATVSPLVLVLEDAHWADPASLDLMRFLSRQVAELPLLLVITYRADELSKGHPLYHLLPVLVREADASRIDLRPLPESDVRALVRARYRLPEADEHRLVAYLYERAEGNPFFTSELLRAVEEQALLRPPDPLHDEWALGDMREAHLPALLRQVIDGRLIRLGEEAQRLLAVAAVIGQEVPLALWEQVGEVSEKDALDTVETAVEAHLLEETRDRTRVRFVHALIREAVYAGIPLSRRRTWHRQVGEALAVRARPDPDAVAHHLRQAGDARAVEWLVRAGERAQRLYAWWTAADRFEAALALMEAAGDDACERGWLLYRMARLRRYATPKGGIAALEETERLADLAGDRTLAAYARCDRGALRCFSGDLRLGIAELEAGIAALDALPSVEEASGNQRVALWVADTLPAGDTPLTGTESGDIAPGEGRRGTLVIWLAMAGRFEEARALGEQMMAQAPAAMVARGQAGNTYADACYGLAIARAALGQPEAARWAFARCRDLSLKSEHYITAGYTGLVELLWAVVPYQADRLGERQRVAAEAERTWTRASGAAQAPLGAQLLVMLLDGRWAEARELALALYAVRAEVRDRPAVELAWLAHQQGDAELVEALAWEVLPAGPATEPGGCDFLSALGLLRAQASLAVDAGDLPEARAWLDAHDRWLAWSGSVLWQAEGQLTWSAYHRAAEEPDLAYHLATEALARATEPRQPLALLAAHRLLGELDTGAGRYDAAAAHLDEALALSTACAAPYERALTLLAQAGWHAASGNREDAQALLDEVRATCAPLGAARALAQADALTAQWRAGSPPGSASAYSAGLTEREVAVLRLIAAGKSNREIGAELFVSPRTIERHITNAYRKIDAHGKADATAYVLRHHLA